MEEELKMSRLSPEKYGFLLSGVLLLLTVLYSFAPAKENKKQIQTRVNETSTKAVTEEEVTPKRLPIDSDTPPLISDQTREPLLQPPTTSLSETQLHAPSLAEVRKDLAEDPQMSPRSFVDFVSALTPKMRKAYDSEEFASAFFKELRECALNFSNSETIQRVCLSYGKVLFKKYPNFEAEWPELINEIKLESQTISD